MSIATESVPNNFNVQGKVAPHTLPRKTNAVSKHKGNSCLHMANDHLTLCDAGTRVCLEITKMAAPDGKNKSHWLENDRKPNATCDVYEDRHRRYALAALQGLDLWRVLQPLKKATGEWPLFFPLRANHFVHDRRH